MSESLKWVSCSDRLKGLPSVVHQRGNYFPKLVLKLDFLAPSNLPGLDGTQYPLSLGEQLVEGGCKKTDKVKALFWLVINWFALQPGRGWRMTLRGHEGDEEVTNTEQVRSDYRDKNN